MGRSVCVCLCVCVCVCVHTLILAHGKLLICVLMFVFESHFDNV